MTSSDFILSGICVSVLILFFLFNWELKSTAVKDPGRDARKARSPRPSIGDDLD